jgi:hypothetical protein
MSPGDEVPAPARPRRQTTLSLQAIPAHEVPRLDRAARLLVALAVAALLAVLVRLATRGDALPPLAWDAIVPPAQVAIQPWRWIVIHHGPAGCGDPVALPGHAAGFARGTGYHFIIGEGLRLAPGQVEPGFRWREQREGAHLGRGAKDASERDALGVCLEGDHDAGALDARSERRLVELCAELVHHVPTLSLGRIVDHQRVSTRPLSCPGRQLDLDRLRFLVRQELTRRGLTAR